MTDKTECPEQSKTRSDSRPVKALVRRFDTMLEQQDKIIQLLEDIKNKKENDDNDIMEMYADEFIKLHDLPPDACSQIRMQSEFGEVRWKVKDLYSKGINLRNIGPFKMKKIRKIINDAKNA